MAKNIYVARDSGENGYAVGSNGQYGVAGY